MNSETGQALTYAGPVIGNAARDSWRDLGVHHAGRVAVYEELIAFLGGQP